MRGFGLLTLVCALFTAPHLEADTVLFKDSSGSGTEVIPGYYFDFSTCAAQQYYTGTTIPIPQLPAGSCQPFEGYPYTEVADTIPGAVYIGDPAGYVSDEIVTTFPLSLGCTVGGVNLDPASCAQYFTDVKFVFTYGLDLTGSPFTCASVGGCDFVYNGSIQNVGVITWGPGLFPVSGFSTTLEFQAPTTTLIAFQGGSSSTPVLLPSGQPVGAITGAIGGSGTEDYYSFLWPGGTFIATASVPNAPNAGASYLFSEGVAGDCTSGGMATLNSSNNFASTIEISSLAPGPYCIGIDATSLNDPAFTLTFDTAVTSSQTPEPSGLASLPIGLCMIGAIGLTKRSRKAC